MDKKQSGELTLPDETASVYQSLMDAISLWQQSRENGAAARHPMLKQRLQAQVAEILRAQASTIERSWAPLLIVNTK
jgi:hypothetical protein